MVLDLLKWLKETIFYKKSKKLSKNMNFCTKGKFILKKKERVYEFYGLRKS